MASQGLLSSFLTVLPLYTDVCLVEKAHELQDDEEGIPSCETCFTYKSRRENDMT